MPNTKKTASQPMPLTEQLRNAIVACGVSRYRIAKETGVSESALAQFVNGHRGLSMSALNSIGQFLRLKVVANGKPTIRSQTAKPPHPSGKRKRP